MFPTLGPPWFSSRFFAARFPSRVAVVCLSTALLLPLLQSAFSLSFLCYTSMNICTPTSFLSCHSPVLLALAAHPLSLVAMPNAVS